jgi:hypothetical protein
MFLNETYKALDSSVVNVMIPGLTIGTVEQPTAVRPIWLPGSSFEISDLACTFMLDEKFNNFIMLYKWIMALKDEGSTLQSRQAIDVSMELLDNKYNPYASFLFGDCFPHQLADIPMTTQDAAEPIRFECYFKINRIKLVETI